MPEVVWTRGAESDLQEKFKYITRNPWDARIAKEGEDYRWVWYLGSYNAQEFAAGFLFTFPSHVLERRHPFDSRHEHNPRLVGGRPSDNAKIFQ